MFLAANLLYLLFAAAVGAAFYFFIRKRPGIRRKKLAAFALFVAVWMAPFYDLFIQKGIKTYYQIFHPPRVYAYPERDAEGKLESLALYRVFYREPVTYLKDREHRERFRRDFKNVSKFIELYLFDDLIEVTDANGTVRYEVEYESRCHSDFGYARVYLDRSPLRVERLRDERDYRARFQAIGKRHVGWFAETIEVEFWDMKKKILLGRALRLSFGSVVKGYNDKFRNKYLFYRGGNGIALSLDGIDNRCDMFYKIFKIIL
jgi:hypothetical protein